MECIDWICGNVHCKLNNNIKVSFQNILCKECKNKMVLKKCKTCIYGEVLNDGIYLCLRDNTIGVYSY